MAENASKIVHALLVHGAQWRDGLTKEEFWRRATVSKARGNENVHTLEQQRIVRDEPKAITFGPALGLVLGISVGSESLRAALVDANGDVVVSHQADALQGRLADHPETILAQIGQAARHVLKEGLEHDHLHLNKPARGVAPALPLIGVATGWSAPIERETGLPVGRSMSIRWSEAARKPLAARVASQLGLPAERSRAINAAHAVALGVAFDDLRSAQYAPSADQRGHVELAVRLGGCLNAGTVIVEPHRLRPASGGGSVVVSGFCATRLIEGTKGGQATSATS